MVLGFTDSFSSSGLPVSDELLAALAGGLIVTLSGLDSDLLISSVVKELIPTGCVGVERGFLGTLRDVMLKLESELSSPLDCLSFHSI